MRYAKQVTKAPVSDPVRTKSAREAERFDSCKVKVVNKKTNIYSVVYVNEFNGKPKKSPLFLFLVRMPVGIYDVVDYAEDYIAVKHQKTGKIYVNQCVRQWDVRCDKCWGRGKTRELVKRKRTDDGKFEFGAGMFDGIHESQCSCGDGIDINLLPDYPSVLEIKKRIILGDDKEFEFFDGESWSTVSIKKSKKEES